VGPDGVERVTRDRREYEDTRERPEPLAAFAGRAVARALPEDVRNRLSPQHLAAIELAPPRYWEDMAHNAAAGGWSVALTERMARSLVHVTPEQARAMLADPQVPHRPLEDGPEAGQPVIALETVLRNQRPPHLDPNRARVAVRSFFSAMGALGRFDHDLAIGAFGAGDWDYLQRELETALGLVMDLQAALDRARSGRPR
jgi:hypothetical protein